MAHGTTGDTTPPTTPKTGHLEVPGASLYYEVRGSGPVLLLIPGGPADATGFADLADRLADRYTVVSYDPRGITRSTIADPDTDVQVDVQADDASLLLAAFGSEPAYVFGNSGGAVTGLALISRHPGRVRTLVAHEAPVVELLPDRDRHRAEVAAQIAMHRDQGAFAAMDKFLSDAGVTGGLEEDGDHAGPPEPGLAEAMAGMRANLDLFFAHMIGPITAYRPDTAALSPAPSRIVVAAGTESRGQVAHQTALALAAALGTEAVDVPGDHGGFGAQPVAFAERLHTILAAG